MDCRTCLCLKGWTLRQWQTVRSCGMRCIRMGGGQTSSIRTEAPKCPKAPASRQSERLQLPALRVCNAPPRCPSTETLAQQNPPPPGPTPAFAGQVSGRVEFAGASRPPGGGGGGVEACGFDRIAAHTSSWAFPKIGVTLFSPK